MSIRRWWGDDSVSLSLPKVSSCQTMLPGTMGRNREIKCKASSRWLSVDMTTTFSHVISCFSGCGAATATKEVMKSKLRGRMGFISGTVVTSLFKRVSVACIISISAPLFKRGEHFVARFLHFCCRWRKNRAARGGFARSGALVCRVEERLESLKSLPIFGLEKGQKYSLFMGHVHNAFIINTTFI